MNVLLRHSILGEGIRLLNPHVLPYQEELNPSVLKTLHTLQAAQSDPAHADENSALLADGEHHFGSETLLVDWYEEDDPEVGFLMLSDVELATHVKNQQGDICSLLERIRLIGPCRQSRW